MGRALGERWMNYPRPQFSTANPYWQDPRKFFKGLAPEALPRLSARDFLYATTWEVWRPDIHGAYCVRSATQLTVRLNFRIGTVNQIKEMRKDAKTLKAGISTACWLGARIRVTGSNRTSTAEPS